VKLPLMILIAVMLVAGMTMVSAGDAPTGATPALVTPRAGSATTTTELASSTLTDPSVTPAKPVPALNLGPLTVAMSPDAGGKGLSTSMSIILLITVLAVAPGFLMMMTSFTRVIIVLGFLRRAIGTQTLPPNQVMVGLALFLTMYIMAPTIKRINDDAIQPYLTNTIGQEQALDKAKSALRDFMSKQTRKNDLALFIRLAGDERPKTIEDVAFTTLVPAFVTSELKTSFQMGFIIFLPFLVIDLVTSAVLMALGMMMLPPAVVSLPFKILLFVLVDGWTLLMQGLVSSYA
jgi:flagellar biosynthetic protein FliP